MRYYSFIRQNSFPRAISALNDFKSGEVVVGTTQSRIIGG